MLVPDGKIIGQLLFKLRRKSGEPLSKFGDAIRGFRGFGVAADFLQSLQGPSAAFCQSPGNAKNNLSPPGAAEIRNTGTQSFLGISFGSRLDLRGCRLPTKWGDEMFRYRRRNRPVVFKAIFSNVRLAESVRNFENKGFFQC